MTSNLVTLNVMLTVIGREIHPFEVKVRLTDTVETFKEHLKNSLDITGRLTTKNGEHLDSLLQRSLKEVGILPNSTVVMTSFKSNIRLQHSHTITVHLKNYSDFKFKVRSATDVDELRHIVQDKLGMPIGEQVYMQHGKVLRRGIKVVSLCQHGRGKLILIWQPSPKPEPEPRRRALLRQAHSTYISHSHYCLLPYKSGIFVVKKCHDCTLMRILYEN